MAPDNTENDGIPSIGSWYTVVSTTIYHEKTRDILLLIFEKKRFYTYNIYREEIFEIYF